MNICLINPQRLLEVGVPTLKSTAPLGLAYIAGALQQAGHRVQIIDAIAENPHHIFPFDGQISVNGMGYNEMLAGIKPDTEVIGFTFMFSNNWLLYRHLIEITGKAFPQAKVIAGGEHITAIPHICLKQTTQLYACILGEGEETAVALVEAIAGGTPLSNVEGLAFKTSEGEICTTQRRSRIRKLDEIAWPAWDLFPLENYDKYNLSWGVKRGRKTLPIMATRGCPYECTFCSSPAMWTTKYSMRTPDDVANEVQLMYDKYGIRNFDFYDLTAVINKRWIIEFCQVLVNRGLDITWQIPAGTRSEAIDYEVATWLYKSGCRNITYAPESGSPEILNIIKKRVHLDNILKSMRDSDKAGLNIKLNMIIGFPDEHHKHIWQTFFFLIRAAWNGAHDTIPAIFSPYPGSALFNQLVEEKEVDAESDTYYRNLVFYDSMASNKIYNHHVAPGWIRFYQIFILVMFYVFNYLFRPWRFFRTIYNVSTRRIESRAEDTLLDFIDKLRIFRKKSSVVATAATNEV